MFHYSASSSLRAAARDNRAHLCNEVLRHPGVPIAVLGDNGEEIAEVPEVAAAVNHCQTHGMTIEAGPWGSELKHAAAKIHAAHPAAKTILVTGAWADRKDGCVTTVAAALRGKYGSRVAISVSPFAPSCDTIEEEFADAFGEAPPLKAPPRRTARSR